VKRTDTNGLQDPELVEFIGERRKELFNLRFQHATGQLENTARLRQAKRELARGLTVAHARDIDVDRELKRQKHD
jgi:large subunit ribosomal protein L29